MNWTDFAIIGIILLSTLFSLYRGFIREAFSLVIWIFSFWLAIHFAGNFAPMFAKYIATPSFRYAAAFIILLIASLIIGSLCSFLLQQLVRTTGLTSMDRLLGIFFGVIRGVLIIALILFILSFTPVVHDPWWQHSQLIPYFENLIAWLKTMVANYK